MESFYTNRKKRPLEFRAHGPAQCCTMGVFYVSPDSPWAPKFNHQSLGSKVGTHVSNQRQRDDWSSFGALESKDKGLTLLHRGPGLNRSLRSGAVLMA